MLESEVKYLKKNGTKEDWKEIQKKYPDMWTILTGVKENNKGEILKFNLLALAEEQDLHKYIEKYRDLDCYKYLKRTTYADEYTEAIKALESGDLDKIDWSNM